jgi:hypothetical protein
MTDDLQASDRLFFGIQALKGWDSALYEATGFGSQYAWRIGQMLSAILLAGGEDSEPIALAGTLDDDGTGSIVVVYSERVVVVDVSTLSANGGDVTVTVHPLADVRVVSVRTKHNYFDGVERSPRHQGIAFTASIGGREVEIESNSWSNSDLQKPDAVFAAFKLLRDSERP